MINVSIAGGTGYTGGELLRLLLNHPQVKIDSVTSTRSVGVPIADI
ncbi:MAG TPA: N-acetyl-gamma-glutamyl-phosphate reductase, partial [Dysgonamonadaceae bacterium]|nr:N-acetyl-gamma-glutamyl-phosphate reductase [Dysgonamonadaceae bacterium]